MAKIDRVFQEVVNRAVESVPVKELKGNFLGQVKAADANTAIKEAVNETAERVGAEIQANYTKAFVTRLPNGDSVTTTPELNGILRETFSTDSATGKRYMSHYERTTTKGTYEIDLNPDGTYKSSTIKSPNGTRTRVYTNGKFQKPQFVEDWMNLEKAHEANKGRIISHSEEKSTRTFGDVTGEVNYINNHFADGSSELVVTSSSGEGLEKSIALSNGDSIHKNLQSGVTTFRKVVKPKPGKYINDAVIPVAYHTDKTTGQTSTAIVTKTMDELGRDVREIEMNFAPYTEIKAGKFVYTLESDGGPYANRVKGKLISGSFEVSAGNETKTVVYKNGKLIVNGKELTGENLRELGYRPNGTTSEEYGFELLFNRALEDARIGKDFNLAKYSHLWNNM